MKRRQLCQKILSDIIISRREGGILRNNPDSQLNHMQNGLRIVKIKTDESPGGFVVLRYRQ